MNLNSEELVIIIRISHNYAVCNHFAAHNYHMEETDIKRQQNSTEVKYLLPR